MKTKRRRAVNHGGRPRKFSEPSGPITVTLPHRTLRQLEQIDRDRARAIAHVVDIVAPQDVPGDKLVETIEVDRGVGMFVVGPCRALRRIPFLRMVEVAPARYLLTVRPGTSSGDLEVALADVVEDLPGSEKQERALLSSLLEHLRHHRRKENLSRAEVLFVPL